MKIFLFKALSGSAIAHPAAEHTREAIAANTERILERGGPDWQKKKGFGEQLAVDSLGSYV